MFGYAQNFTNVLFSFYLRWIVFQPKKDTQIHMHLSSCSRIPPVYVRVKLSFEFVRIAITHNERHIHNSSCHCRCGLVPQTIVLDFVNIVNCNRISMQGSQYYDNQARREKKWLENIQWQFQMQCTVIIELLHMYSSISFLWSFGCLSLFFSSLDTFTIYSHIFALLCRCVISQHFYSICSKLLIYFPTMSEHSRNKVFF